jgi:hypothetical protein
MFSLCGGDGMPADMHAMLLTLCQRAPTLHTVQMWKVRAAIPSGWLASVLYALDKRGHTPQTFFTHD